MDEASPQGEKELLSRLRLRTGLAVETWQTKSFRLLMSCILYDDGKMTADISSLYVSPVFGGERQKEGERPGEANFELQTGCMC